MEELEEEFDAEVEHLTNADEKPFDILIKNLEKEVAHYSQKMWNSDILGDYLHGFGWCGVLYPPEIKVRLDSATQPTNSLKIGDTKLWSTLSWI